MSTQPTNKPAVKRATGRLTQSQSRAARRIRKERRRRFTRWTAFLGVALVAFLFIFSLFAPGINNLSFGRSGPDGPGENLPLPDGYESLVTNHLLEIDAPHTPYNSRPASSGWHIGNTSSWGIHDFIIPDERLVHNLEHGGIRIHYNCPDGCDQLVSNLSRVADRALNENMKVILSPHNDMETTIALVAWRFLDKFDEFDERRILDFISAHESSPNSPEPNSR